MEEKDNVTPETAAQPEVEEVKEAPEAQPEVQEAKPVEAKAEPVEVKPEPVEVKAEPVEEAKPEPANDGVAVAEKPAQPMWVKILNIIASVMVLVAGFGSIIFMSILGYKVSATGMDTKQYDLSGIADKFANIGKMKDYDIVEQLLPDIFVICAICAGMIMSLVFFIILLVKTIKQYAKKQDVGADKCAMGAFLTYAAIAMTTRSFVISSYKSDGFNMNVTYSTATEAGLAICGIAFASYVAIKIVTNYKTYFAGKQSLVCGILNLAKALIIMVLLCLVAAAPVGYKAEGLKVSGGFINCISTSLSSIMQSTKLPEKVATDYMMITVFGFAGMGVQIAFLFVLAKNLKQAVGGTLEANKPSSLGASIGHVIIGVAFMLCAIVVATSNVDVIKYGTPAKINASIGTAVGVLIMAIVSLALSITHKVLNKKNIA